jgi:hypothetical protein
MQEESPRTGFIAMPSDSPSDYVVAVNYIHSCIWSRGGKSAENFMAFEM